MRHPVHVRCLRGHPGDTRRHDERAEGLSDHGLRLVLPDLLLLLHHGPCARLRDFARRTTPHRRAPGALLRGIRERAEVVELHAPEIRHHPGEPRLGLARKARHDRRAQGDVGHELAQDIRPRERRFDRASAVHPREDFRHRVLYRHVDVANSLFGGNHPHDEILVDLARIAVHHPDPEIALYLLELPKQV